MRNANPRRRGFSSPPDGWLVVVFWWLVVMASPAMAQSDPEAPVGRTAGVTLTVDAIESAKATMEADAGLDGSVKEALAARYDEAIEMIGKAEEIAVSRAGFEDALTEAPLASAELRDELTRLAAGVDVASVDLDGSFDEIQIAREAKRAEMDALRGELERLEGEIEAIGRRPVAISQRLPDLRNEMLEAEGRLGAVELEGESLSPGRAVERLNLEARVLALGEEMAALEAEQRSQAVREALLADRRDVVARRLELAKRQFEQLTERSQEFVADESRRVSEATAGAEDDDAADPIRNQLAEEVRALGAEFEFASGQTEEAIASREEIVARTEILQQEFELIRAQLEFEANGEVMTPALFQVSRRLKSLRGSDDEAQRADQLINDARLAALRVEEQLRSRSDERGWEAGDGDDGAASLFELRESLLKKLRQQYAAQIRELAQLRSAVDELREVAIEVRRFLSEQLFLVRSAPPISSRTMARLPESFAWFFDPGHWMTIVNACKEAARARPLSTGLLLVMVLGLFLVRPWLVSRLTVDTKLTRRISSDHYGLTARAVLYTSLIALPWPLLLLYVNWALVRLPQSNDDWMWSIERALPVLIGTTSCIAWVMAVCVPGGLWEHFRWNESMVRATKRTLLLFALIYLPAVLIVSVCAFGQDAAHFDSLGRLAFMAAHLWMGWLAWRWSCVRQDPVGGELVGAKGPTSPHLPWAWRVLLVGYPVFLVILAAIGYLVTAIDLSLLSLSVVGIGLGGVLVYWLAVRWFMICERRIALENAMVERERVRAERRGSVSSDESPGEVEVIEEDPESIDLSEVSDQTRRLLRGVCGVAAAGLALVYLAGAVPIVSAIDQWQFFGSISVLGFLQMLTIAAITTIVAMNLPGLLELAILSRTSIPLGTRHAICTLAQYAIIATGLVLFFGILRVDWTHFGWIAAALSVGLGFGLQEVVTNFVCGLLLLFERPIRVGDVVTIDGTTGKVTRIRMRATTVTNWDGQELIVPNKQFITGTLLNWSLSNAMNRVTVPVGVAYGSDTTLALQILYDVASEHPLTLDDPAPMVSFEGFGESTLNLFLRTYLPDMDNRLKVVTELHQEIDRRFAEAGIVIAFPQREVHLVVD